MSIGLSIVVGWSDRSPYYATVAAFKTRAEADGGVFEAFGCVDRAIQSSPEAELARQLFDAYNGRVELAGGSTEARTCTINELNEIL